MKTVAAHLLPNAAFLAALSIAARWEIGWLRVLVVAFVWFMLAIYLVVLSDADSRTRFRSRTEPLPLAIVAAIDTAALSVLVDAGWYITAAAYVVSAVIPVAVYGTHRLFAWTVDRQA